MLLTISIVRYLIVLSGPRSRESFAWTPARRPFPERRISMRTEAPVLDRCPFFDHFQPKHLEKLAALGSFVYFSKDEIVFQEGDDDSKFYVILSGKVALELSSGGQRILVDTLYPGDELGWSAVLERKKQFRARALEPVEATAFKVDGLEQPLTPIRILPGRSSKDFWA